MRGMIADALDLKQRFDRSYRFHVSLGYPVQWLTEQEEREKQISLDRCAAAMAQRSPVVLLGRPEFRTFEDMFAFKRILYL